MPTLRAASFPAAGLSISTALRRSVLVACLLGLLCSPALVSATSAAIAVTLEDQFGKKQRLSQLFSHQPVVMVAGDEKATAEHMKAWVDALSAPLAGQAKLLGLAELDSVPFFVPNSSITSKLAKMLPTVRVLCDWDNEAYERIGFNDDTLVAVGVFDSHGTLRKKITGKHSAALQAQVLSAVSAVTNTKQ